MRLFNRQFPPKLIALAVSAAFAPAASAAEVPDEVAEYSQPSSSIGAGLQVASGDKKSRSFFGQYSGMRQQDAYGLLDIDLVKRDDATGTWMIIRGNNLGLDNRDLAVTYEKQGDWKIGGSFNQITHRELRTINTADTGVGTTTPHAILLGSPGTGTDIDLKLQRKGLGLEGNKWLTDRLFLEINFRNEDKDGARFTGKGYDCASYVCTNATATAGKTALLMQAEPVNYNTKQLDLRLSYSVDKFNINGGYYGSFFKNANGSVNMTVDPVMKNGNGTGTAALYGPAAGTVIAGGGTSLQNVLQSPFALPPDNQAHQFYVDGNYGFTKTTKANFKVAYTRATQDESYASMGLYGGPAGVSSLGGKVDTTLFQLGITSKPISKLSLAGNVRYEKRDDKTPQYLYNVEAQNTLPVTPAPTYTFTNSNQPGTGANPATWYNAHTSSEKTSGKVEASYQLLPSYRTTVGFNYDEIKREVPTSIYEDFVAGITALREKTRETGFHLGLTRVMSDELTGSVTYYNSHRRGSDWTSLSTLNPTLQNNILGTAPNYNYASTAGTAASRQAAALANLALINAYCGGSTCYGQQLSPASILALSSTAIFPVSMTDLNREKWRALVNWNPTQKTSLQLTLENGSDKNQSPYNPVAGGKGYRKGSTLLYSLDGAYSINDDWRVTSYLSRGKQAIYVNHSTGYMADISDQSDAVGLGIKGQISGRFAVGAGFNYLNDVTTYRLGAAGSATGAAPSATNVAQADIGLPKVEYSQTTFNIFGVYALEKNADLRVDLGYQRDKLREWSWGYNGVAFAFADNTTLTLQASQAVTYVAARYIYKFR